MIYLTNGRVAWQIPPGRIEDRYREGVYLGITGILPNQSPDISKVNLANIERMVNYVQH